MIPHVTLRLFGSCLLCVAASPDFVFIASQVVSGELRFVKKIGEGAFGEVWEVSVACTAPRSAGPVCKSDERREMRL